MSPSTRAPGSNPGRVGAARGAAGSGRGGLIPPGTHSPHGRDDREILSNMDVAILGKIAAHVYGADLLDDVTSPAVIDLARRCWLAQEEGRVLAVGLTFGDLLTEGRDR